MKDQKTKEEILKDFSKGVDGKYTMQLTEAIKHGSKEITEFVLAEPKAKHIRKMPTDPKTDDVLKVVGDLASQPDSVIDELCLKDCNRLAEFFGAFN